MGEGDATWRRVASPRAQPTRPPAVLPAPAYTPSARKERGCTLDPKGKTLEAG